MNKKILIFIFFVGIFLLPIIGVEASRSTDITPGDYVITINNIRKEDVSSIDVLYGTEYYFNFESGYRRTWLEETGFGYQYKDYSDAEIIPKLTESQIDEIASLYTGRDGIDKINGLWLQQDNNKEITNFSSDMRKFGYNLEAKVKFFDNYVKISYLGNSKSNYNFISDYMYIRIVKKNNEVLYSKQIHSKLTDFYDENTPNEEIDKIYEVEKETAYFEVDFSKISNNFDVIELDNNSNVDYTKGPFEINLIWLIIPLGILIIFWVIKIKKKNDILHE